MNIWLLKLYRKSIQKGNEMHIFIDVALGKRTCSECKSAIKKGDVCIKGEGGWNAQTHSAGNLCMKCLNHQLKRKNLQIVTNCA